MVFQDFSGSWEPTDTFLGDVTVILGGFDLEWRRLINDDPDMWLDFQEYELRRARNVLTAEAKHAERELHGVWFGMQFGTLDAAHTVLSTWDAFEPDEIKTANWLAWQIATRMFKLFQQGEQWGLIHVGSAESKAKEYLNSDQIKAWDALNAKQN